ncbi:MAG: DUF4214 domain-containing protein, partial [Pseudomonadales bacterium]|nr:DUF4214 domain-containing protein [Pseudomonadales bacterium]
MIRHSGLFAFLLAAFTQGFSTFVTAQCSSAEFSGAENKVISAYIAYYGRIPDTAGLEFWSGEVEQQGSLDAIIESFGNSKEFESNFAHLDSETLINNLYLQAFSRSADDAGLAFYVDELENGRISLQEIAVSIINGIQGEDEEIIRNKIAVGQHYVIQALDQGIEFSEDQMAGLLDVVSTDETSTIEACEAITSVIEELVVEQEDNEFFTENSCDNGSDENEPIKKSATLEGVSGLSYSSETEATVAGIKKSVAGVTGLNGEFEYYEMCGESASTAFCMGVKKNCDVEEVVAAVEIDRMRLGRRILGIISDPGDEVSFEDIVSQSFPDQTDEGRQKIRRNIYRLLLTLDEDGDQENGIALNETIRTQAEDFADNLDFTLDQFEDDQQVINFIAAAGADQLVPRDQADESEASLPLLPKSFTVSGSILGLEGPITLSLNDREQITTFPRTFSFTSRLQPEQPYLVRIVEIPDQFECVLDNAQGIIAFEPVTNVRVLCRDKAGSEPDGEVPDGETPGGDVPDGELPGGEVPDGEVPDGEVPDGEVPDGEVPDGEVPDGEVPDG